MKAEFRFSVYSRRWGHEDTYGISINQDGWYVQHLSISGQCDPEGNPYLYANFDQDFIQHPSGLPDRMERLWSSAREGSLTEKEVQGHLDDLANWVSICEKSTPEEI